MPSKAIDPKSAAQDIRAGLDGAAMMRKYNLNLEGLISLYDKLLAHGELSESEARDTMPSLGMDLNIRNQFTDEIIFSSTAESVRELVESAFQQKVDLSEADLSHANLFELVAPGVQLSESTLYRVNLRRSDLSSATLFHAGARSKPTGRSKIS